MTDQLISVDDTVKVIHHFNDSDCLGMFSLLYGQSVVSVAGGLQNSCLCYTTAHPMLQVPTAIKQRVNISSTADDRIVVLLSRL